METQALRRIPFPPFTSETARIANAKSQAVRQAKAEERRRLEMLPLHPKHFTSKDAFREQFRTRVRKAIWRTLGRIERAINAKQCDSWASSLLQLSDLEDKLSGRRRHRKEKPVKDTPLNTPDIEPLPPA